MPVTLEQIASRTNLSPVTVARILRGQNKENRPTAVARGTLVRRVARELDYRPNAAARAMRAGKFNAVALLQSELPTSSLLPGALLGGIQQALADRHTHLILATLPDAKLTSREYVPTILREYNCDGLLINYNANIPSSMVDLIDANQLPSVWINSKQAHHSVHPDDEGAGTRAASMLLDLGHRRIAYLDFVTDTPAGHYSSVDRYAGYESMMRNAGLPAYRFGHPTIWRRGDIVTAQRQWLRQDDRPTAVIAYGDIDARALQMAAALEGLSIPRDLSLITFGSRHLDDLGLRLTSMLIPEQAVGRRAVELLNEQIADPNAKQPRVAAPFGFEPGRSIGPVPESVEARDVH